jgi:hypothetical protein
MNDNQLRARQWVSAHAHNLNRPSVAYNAIISSLTDLLDHVAAAAVEKERLRVQREVAESWRTREEASKNVSANPATEGA